MEDLTIKKTELNFKDLEKQWKRINSVIPARPLLLTLLDYFCETEDPLKWRMIFKDQEEQRKIVSCFWRKNGGGKRLQEPDELDMLCQQQLVPFYLNDKETEEFAYIADVLLKFYDLMFPNARNVSGFDVIGYEIGKSLGNMSCNSSWNLDLSKTTFEDQYSFEDFIGMDDSSSFIVEVDDAPQMKMRRYE